MNMVKYNVLRTIYGSKIIEAITLDMLLEALSDGAPRSYQVFAEPSGEISSWDISRKANKLINDGMVKVTGDWVTITSTGALHLAKGGYTDDIKRHKRALFSFWLSIFAVLISLTSMLLTWLYRQS